MSKVTSACGHQDSCSVSVGKRQPATEPAWPGLPGADWPAESPPSAGLLPWARILYDL